MARSPKPDRAKETTTEEVNHLIQKALESGDLDQVIDVLESAPNWLKKEPSYMLLHASTTLAMGDRDAGLRELREVEKKFPGLPGLHLTLATYYHEEEWPGHALKSGKLALADRELDDEAREGLENIIAEATSEIQNKADLYHAPFEKMQRAIYLNEQAQLSMQDKKLHEAEYYAKEAIKQLPGWNPAHNNLSLALFYQGKINEAIKTLNGVIEREPENIFALRSLAIFHYGLDQSNQAQVYGTRLAQLAGKFPVDSIETEYIILALTLLEDTPALWKIAGRCLNQPAESLSDYTWSCLAIAAVRSGEWKAALKLIRKTNDDDLPSHVRDLKDELLKTARRPNPRLNWMPPAYPGLDLLFSPIIMDEFAKLPHSARAELSNTEQRQLAEFFKKYPFILVALKRMLWAEATSDIAVQSLESLGMPEADAEILRFALSQVGSHQARTQALLALMKSGRYTGPKTVKLWMEDEQEWHDVQLNLQKIVQLPIKGQPKTQALMEKAQKARDPQAAIALMRQAVSHEPTCAQAIFNLGVMLSQNGQEEEGAALIAQSVVVDPSYYYGHAAIAYSLAIEQKTEQALDHLQKVSDAAEISPETAVQANLAWCQLALDRQDFEQARSHYEMAADFDPDNPRLRSIKTRLERAELLGKGINFIRDFQVNSARRSHEKLLRSPLTASTGLRACLETYSKDMLSGCCDVWDCLRYGKKAELLARLEEKILNPDLLRDLLTGKLAKEDLEPLRWLLQANGVCPWKEYAVKFGDDSQESTYWIYHEPKSATGRLRRACLLFNGTLDGQQVAFIPPDLRALLRDLLG